MPKRAMDYSNTQFYKIACKDVNIKDCYIGHTTNLTKRKYHHKNLCNNINNRAYNRYVYQFIRENGGWDNFQVVLINTECCLNSLEAENRERYYIESLHATLNKARPTITKEEEKEYDRQHYLRNKERHNTQTKINHQKNKERDNEKARQYYYKNREHILRRQREMSHLQTHNG